MDLASRLFSPYDLDPGGRRPATARGRLGRHAHPPDRKPAHGRLGYSSQLNAEWEFLCMLRDEGRHAADAFLAEHGQNLGHRSSLDLDQLLEGV